MPESKSRRNIWLTVLFVLAAAAVIAAVIGIVNRFQPKQQALKPTVQEGLLMDTYVRQTAYDTDPEIAQKLKAMFDFLAEFEQQTSAYLADSEISKINDYAGVMAVEVSEPVFQLLKRSRELCLQSGGRFDITVGSLVELWGITSDSPKVPLESDIQVMKQRVDINKLILDEKNKTAKLNAPYMQLDLGGTAKGYACDLAVQKYQALGVKSCLLSLGGNICSIGTKPDGTAFIIGLRDPRGGENELLGTLTAPDRIISTTGDYERYFEENGTRYHHVLDPKTGYPAQTDLISVTVLAKEGLFADYMSTNLFLAGKAEVQKNLKGQDFDVIAVDKDKKVYVSDGIKKQFQLSENSTYQLAE